MSKILVVEDDLPLRYSFRAYFCKKADIMAETKILPDLLP